MKVWRDSLTIMYQQSGDVHWMPASTEKMIGYIIKITVITGLIWPDTFGTRKYETVDKKAGMLFNVHPMRLKNILKSAAINSLQLNLLLRVSFLSPKQNRSTAAKKMQLHPNIYGI